VDQDAALGKIRKLLAMAECIGLTPEARESYTAKAAELIAQYGIDEALASEHRPTREGATDRIIVVHRPYADAKLYLLSSVFIPLGLVVVGKMRDARLYAEIGDHCEAHVFGMASDLDRAELIYTSLLVQSALNLGVASPPQGSPVASFRRRWYRGFAYAVQIRLKAAERYAAEQAEWNRAGGRSTALVLADRASLVKAAACEAYPHMRKTRQSTSGAGFDAGRAAGNRADLGGRKVGAGAGRALPR
jgi:hypothetical protein